MLCRRDRLRFPPLWPWPSTSNKGRKVLVEGRLRYHAWENEDGQKRSKVDVIANRVNFLPRASKNGNGSDNGADEFDGTIPGR